MFGLAMFAAASNKLECRPEGVGLRGDARRSTRRSGYSFTSKIREGTANRAVTHFHRQLLGAQR
jgi:hypothetical protein